VPVAGFDDAAVEARKPLGMTIVELPWPSRDLHPNARVHWARKAKATKQARSDAAWLALSSGVRTYDFAGADRLGVTLVFIPPDNRARDTDGMISSVKGYCDGIADVVGVDDSKWVLSIRREEPRKPGFVRVEISNVASASTQTAGEENVRDRAQRTA
jgi:crossover junction endodeoxyribonuclease RusA